MTRIRLQATDLPHAPSPVATVLEPRGAADRRGPNLRHLREAIEGATSLFHSSVAASLPRQSANQDFALSRTKASWEECIHQLRSLKTLLLHAADNDQARTQIADQHAVVKRLWEKSAQSADKLLSRAGRTEDRPPWWIGMASVRAHMSGLGRLQACQHKPSYIGNPLRKLPNPTLQETFLYHWSGHVHQ